MNLEQNPFTQNIAKGEKQVGIWVSLSSPFSAELIAHAGYDWALVDMEHAPNDYFSVLGQLQAFASSKTTAIVRPEWNDPVVVKRLLDLGAQGLLFPMIQNVEEAKKAVASTRYPPHGNRGVSAATRATKFGRVTDYITRVDDEMAVLLQLETIAALDKAEEIGAVEGVSGIFFGPADIAADMGKVGRTMDGDVWDKIRATAKKLIAMGVPVGTLVLDPDLAAELINDGFTFVACGSDISLLAKSSDALLANVKGKIDEC
jgi:4-hydroxy-2-oxoheptanedioate aldolase